MNTANIKSNTSIAKAAVVEYFKPILRLVNFIKYIFATQSRDNILFDKVSNIEKNLEMRRVVDLENQEIFGRLEDVILRQELILKTIKKELAEVDTFNDKSGPEGMVSLDPERVSSWLASIKDLTESGMPEEVKGVVSEAYNLLTSVDAQPLSEVISDVIESANSLADQLGKGKPVMDIDNSDILIESEAQSTLNNIFMHVFRNAMDHGIEGIDERIEKGKSESGTIQLHVTREGEFYNLSVKDDGRGMAISRIYKMAIEKGIYQDSDPKPSATEIANLIFSSGFSTADKVTDVSGRGVGMNAVKDFLEEAGGSIDVNLGDGSEDDDFRPFTTNIKIPASFYKVALKFDKTA